MKNIVLAAVLALIAVPALAVGPQPFTVDVSRGYAVTAPCNGPSCSQAQEQTRSNWAPRGQQAQEQASEEGSEATTSRQPRAMKASGKPRSQRQAPQSGNQAGHAPEAGASKTAPAAEGHR